jgi:DNA-binding SARP family transcriptional activator
LQLLLAYLVLHSGRKHARETLAGLFWGDHPDERARACLNTALWRLRAVLEAPGTPRGTYLQTSHGGEIGFNRDSDYWLDVDVFEQQVAGALPQAPHDLSDRDAARVVDALKLYTGDLLEGCFDDWALRERDRLEGLYVDGLEHMMRYHHARGDLETSGAYGRRVLEVEPTREEVHRGLMRVYVAEGRRDRAVKQYNVCRQALGRELAIDPSPETTALYAELVSENGPSPSPADGAAVALVEAVRGLGTALERVQLAQASLERVMERLSGEASVDANATSNSRDGTEIRR